MRVIIFYMITVKLNKHICVVHNTNNFKYTVLKTKTVVFYTNQNK
jgi:hypothetical protein